MDEIKYILKKVLHNIIQKLKKKRYSGAFWKTRIKARNNNNLKSAQIC